jgi:hypothetical protein
MLLLRMVVEAEHYLPQDIVGLRALAAVVRLDIAGESLRIAAEATSQRRLGVLGRAHILVLQQEQVIGSSEEEGRDLRRVSSAQTATGQGEETHRFAGVMDIAAASATFAAAVELDVGADVEEVGDLLVREVLVAQRLHAAHARRSTKQSRHKLIGAEDKDTEIIAGINVSLWLCRCARGSRSRDGGARIACRLNCESLRCNQRKVTRGDGARGWLGLSTEGC